LWIAALLGALVQAAGTLVGKVLVSLGIGYVVYSGVDTSIGWAKDYALANIQSLPTAMVQVLGVLQVGRIISILTSALVVRVTLAGLTGGVKKMVMK
jgi:hypothetical protein